MTCTNIYKTALSLLGETESNPGLDDYATRAPYLLTVITSRLAECSKLIDGRTVTVSDLTLNSAFPLADPLAACAAEMLASMLIFDEAPDLAKTLMAQAEADKPSVAKSESAAVDVGSIREVYGV
ncbi:MAG: hypothetical protein E7632_06015 [Ruminococcaceae bacterium]|nr:hypothetical protein [Oscillospiraceae bacterium]